MQASVGSSDSEPNVNAPVDTGRAHRLDSLDSRVRALQTLFASTTQTVQDSVELAGATLREELESFASQSARAAAAFVCGSIALVLVTAAAVLFLHDVTGNWAVSALGPGLVYAVAAVVLLLVGRGGEQAPR